MLLALAEEQMNRGISPLILSAGEMGQSEKPLESEARARGIPVVNWRMKSGFNLMGAREIYQWAQAEGFQLMHSHGYKFNVLMGLWPEAIRKIPLVTTLHGYVRAPRFTKAWLYELVDRLVLGQMRKVVMVSGAMKTQVPTAIANSSRTCVIPNGLDPASIRRRSSEPLRETLTSFFERHKPVILGVGRLSREKGFDRLVDAFAEIREVFPGSGLLIVGEGQQREALENRIADLDLREAVLMPGYLENVPAIMQRCDVLCIPSFTEGLPITLLEAMTVGLPIVASDVGEIRAVLGDGLGGRVLRIDATQSLTKELTEVLADTINVSEQVTWSTQRISQNYSSRAMAEKYLQIYQQVLA
ncbi:glycosyl transferase [Marinobacter profundi]|uniref:Glycosyl transferase n=2 Tax=Marinobacter profundi TaxID=2666256 RepID=A0A2G1UQ12_9GAMM|nr:glycosyl transferase [Marinobacter profundi]